MTSSPGIVKPHSGAFDAVRLLAALAVLLSHSFALTGHDSGEPLVRLTHGGAGMGEVAVYVFFAISGYLVTQSWTRDPSAVRFMTRRVLRIIPALMFVIVTSVFVLGPITTSLNLPEYFARHETWSYLAKTLIFPAQYGLPGVFENNPIPNVVNGSLWTLRLEFALYVVVAAIGLAGIARGRLSILLAFTCLLCSILITQTHYLDGIPFLHQTTALFLNAVPFFVGAALARYKLNSKIMMLAVLLTVATVWMTYTPAFKPLLLLTLPIATLLIAHYGHCDLSRFGDYSYGIYLWAFPMQQSVIHFVPGSGPWQLFLIAGALTCVMAVVSWHLIEKRALTLKPRRK